MVSCLKPATPVPTPFGGISPSLLSHEQKVVERWEGRRWKGLTGTVLKHFLKKSLNGHVSGQSQVKGQNVVFPRLRIWGRRF